MAKNTRNINPQFSKHHFKQYTLEECIEGLASNRQILSFLISKSESSKEEDVRFIQTILTQTIRNRPCRRLAISGPPGVGKSTFINSLGKLLIKTDKQVAILPVDPSSQLSRGSILGDKTRMDALIGEQNIYVKPTASSQALGGIAPSTLVAQMLCERAGFDYTIIETVGVGQAEFEVRHLVDCFILLLQPGGGDELQGIKRGIMEMADILLVTKADGKLLAQAELSLKSYKSALQLMHPNAYAWKAKALLYSSIKDHQGMGLIELLESYFRFMLEEGKLDDLRKSQAQKYIREKGDKILLELLKSDPQIIAAMNFLESQLLNVEDNPLAILSEFKEKCKNVFD